MKLSSRASFLVLGLFFSLTLVSCASGETFAEAESVALPAEGVKQFGSPVENTVKLLGSDEAGHTFYVGQWEEKYGSAHCLVIDVEEGFERACGGALPITATFSVVRATLDPIASQRTLTNAQEIVGDYLIVEQR